MWKTTTDAKKIQRAVNKIARKLNKTITDDELWKGRFYVHQLDRKTYRYDGIFYGKFLFEFVDKQTGKFAHYWFDENVFIGISEYKFWEKMNFFIVDYVNVWAENPRPNRETSIDYRGR